ncbi:MAG: ABC transporter substrate-binding protein [Bacillota bacterium]
MKKSNLFKIISVIISIVMLSGCAASGGNGEEKPPAEGEKFVVGINQLAEHPALDAAREGFVEALEEAGVDVEIKYQNAQGDIPTSLSIAQGFVKDEVDLIYAIATPAAQSSKQASSDIPVLFSAVTDPVASELVDSMESPGGNVTGTTDATPMKEQLTMFKQLDPSIEKIGILFNTSESNSEIQVARAKEFAQELGLEIVEVGISNINDIPQAMDSMIGDIDGFYAITDNMVASAIAIVADKLNTAGVPSIAAEGSMVEGGLLVSNGISYFELGKQTGEMAKQILVDGKSPAEIPAEKAKGTTTVFNPETLQLLGLDPDHEIFQGAEAVGE